MSYHKLFEVVSSLEYEEEQVRKLQNLVNENYLTDLNFSDENYEDDLRKAGIPIGAIHVIREKLKLETNGETVSGQQFEALDPEDDAGALNVDTMTREKMEKLCSGLNPSENKDLHRMVRLLMDKLYAMFGFNSPVSVREKWAKLACDIFPCLKMKHSTPAHGLLFRPAQMERINGQNKRSPQTGMFETRLNTMKRSQKKGQNVDISGINAKSQRKTLSNKELLEPDYEEMRSLFSVDCDNGQVRKNSLKQRQQFIWNSHALDSGKYAESSRLNCISSSEVNEEFKLWYPTAPQENLAALVADDVQRLKYIVYGKLEDLPCSAHEVFYGKDPETDKFFKLLPYMLKPRQRFGSKRLSDSKAEFYQVENFICKPQQLEDSLKEDSIGCIYDNNGKYKVKTVSGIYESPSLPEAVEHSLKFQCVVCKEFPHATRVVWEFLKLRYYKLNILPLSRSIDDLICKLDCSAANE